MAVKIDEPHGDDKVRVTLDIYFSLESLKEFHEFWGRTCSLDGEEDWLFIGEFLKGKGAL